MQADDASPDTLAPAKLSALSLSSADRAGVALTRVVLEGPAENRGRMHGEVLGELIDAGLRRWRALLSERTGRPPTEIVRALLDRTDFDTTIRRWAPDELAELESLATAAGQSRDEILAYNLMDEEWWWCRDHGADVAPNMLEGHASPGCTALAMRHGANRVPLVAQTMDLSTFYGPGRVLLDLRPSDGAQQLVLSFAGYLGLTGVSRAGISVNVNTLLSLHNSTAGLPVTFVVRRLLSHPDLTSAAAFLRAAPHASGQNYLVASEQGIVDFEASASGVTEFVGHDRVFAHTNHPLANPHEDAEHAAPHPNSVARLAIADTALDTAHSLSDLETILTDRSAPICHIGRAPGEIDTFGAIAVEHTMPPRVRVAPGPPAAAPFVDVPWDGDRSPALS